MNEELLYNQLYDKTKDCGRTQFVKLLMDKERENKELKEELKILSDNYKEMDKFHKSSFLNRSNYIKELEKENQQLKEQQKEFINYLKSMLENEKDNFSVARVKDVLEKYKEIVGDKQ